MINVERSALPYTILQLGHTGIAALYEQCRAKEIECALSATATATTGKKFTTSASATSISEGSKTKSKNYSK